MPPSSSVPHLIHMRADYHCASPYGHLGRGSRTDATERDDRQMTGTDLPKIGAPATRALIGIGVTQLEQVAEQSETELLALHGFGPRASESSWRRSAHGLSMRP